MLTWKWWLAIYFALSATALNMQPDFESFLGVVNREHGYETPSRHAKNPRSSAYGIGQFLDSTWRSVGVRKTDDALWQTYAMCRYIKGRYGSTKNALHFWKAHRYY